MATSAATGAGNGVHPVAGSNHWWRAGLISVIGERQPSPLTAKCRSVKLIFRNAPLTERSSPYCDGTIRRDAIAIEICRGAKLCEQSPWLNACGAHSCRNEDSDIYRRVLEIGARFHAKRGVICEPEMALPLGSKGSGSRAIAAMR
jgi:hypothetical protein